MHIISFIDHPDVIKKILQHLGFRGGSHAPSDRLLRKKRLLLTLSSRTFIRTYHEVFPGLDVDKQSIAVRFTNRLGSI